MRLLIIVNYGLIDYTTSTTLANYTLIGLNPRLSPIPMVSFQFFFGSVAFHLLRPPLTDNTDCMCIAGSQKGTSPPPRWGRFFYHERVDQPLCLD